MTRIYKEVSIWLIEKLADQIEKKKNGKSMFI